MSESFWLQTVEKHESYPPVPGDLHVDVAVVGGGIAGVLTAWYLKKAGLKVALVEAAEIGGGQTGHTTAHLTALTDEPYHQLRKRFGTRGARQVWEAQMQGIALIERFLTGEGMDFDFRRVPAYKYAPDGDHLRELEHEMEALHHMKVDFTEDAVRFPHVKAYRVDEQAKFHPLKFLYQVAARIPGDGSHVFEHSRVTGVDRRGIHTRSGRIRAEHYCFQTNYPFEEVRISIKLQPYLSYALALEGTYDVGDGLYYDNLSPYHYLRTHGDHLIVGGADTHTGGKASERDQLDLLRAFCRRAIHPQPRETHHWYGQVVETLDGLPYIGRRRGNHYLAAGFSGTGLTFGALSGRILADLIVGRENEFAELFDPNRRKGLKTMVEYGLHVAREFVARPGEVHEVGEVGRLEAGDGMLVHHKGQPVAVSKDDEGNVRAVSAVCTHVGCLVRWNTAGKTWDCPCHGSRFSTDGEVITGPAVRNLKPVDLSDEWTVGDTAKTLGEAAAPPPNP